MFEQIKRRIEDKLGQKSRFSIERVPADDADNKHDLSRLSAHVSSQLDRQLSTLYDDADSVEADSRPGKEPRNFGGFETLRQLEKHITVQLLEKMGTPRTALDFVVPSGSRIFGPPYDHEWSVGNGIAFGAKADGQVVTVPTPNGFSGAGISINLMAPEAALVAITPQGSYDWNWIAFENVPFARSSGGMGVTIYIDSEPEPIQSRQQVLWTVSGMSAFSAQSGAGKIADAASPAWGLGTVPLAPVLLNVNPGSKYQVWIWCWQLAHLQATDGFSAFMDFSMPFISIGAGPAISVR